MTVQTNDDKIQDRFSLSNRFTTCFEFKNFQLKANRFTWWVVWCSTTKDRPVRQLYYKWQIIKKEFVQVLLGFPLQTREILDMELRLNLRIFRFDYPRTDSITRIITIDIPTIISILATAFDGILGIIMDVFSLFLNWNTRNLRIFWNQ